MTISSVPRTGAGVSASGSGASGSSRSAPSRALVGSPAGGRGPGDVLALAPGLRLVERDENTLQIGVDPALRILVRRPPPGTADLLRLIDRGVPRSVAVRRTAAQLGVRDTTWDDLVDELVTGGFLVDGSSAAAGVGPLGRSRPRTPSTQPVPRPDARLADAVVVVVGTGRVAASLASLLAAAGTGHVHLDPDRAIRPGDAAPGGLAAEVAAGSDGATVFDLTTGRLRPGGRPSRSDRRPPGPRDHAALAATLRRARPEVEVRRPAGYVRPGLVVVATDAPPDPVLARRFVTDDQPHLAVHAGPWRGGGRSPRPARTFLLPAVSRPVPTGP